MEGPKGAAPKGEEEGRTQKNGAQGGAPQGGASQGGGKISRIFSLFRPEFRSVFLSNNDPKELKSAKTVGAWLEQPQFIEKTPRERRKERNFGREGGENNKIGRSGGGGSGAGGPASGGPALAVGVGRSGAGGPGVCVGRGGGGLLGFRHDAFD